MIILRSTFLDDVPTLDQYGCLDDDQFIEVHVGNCHNEIIHIGFDDPDNSFEVNMSIENAEAIADALNDAIKWAKKGRTHD